MTDRPMFSLPRAERVFAGAISVPGISKWIACGTRYRHQRDRLALKLFLFLACPTDFPHDSWAIAVGVLDKIQGPTCADRVEIT